MFGMFALKLMGLVLEPGTRWWRFLAVVQVALAFPAMAHRFWLEVLVSSGADLLYIQSKRTSYSYVLFPVATVPHEVITLPC